MKWATLGNRQCRMLLVPDPVTGALVVRYQWRFLEKKS
jgi:hypothetical protein